MPVPTHLQGLVVPPDGNLDEEPLEATVRCTCGGESFEMLVVDAIAEIDGVKIPVTAKRDGAFFFRLEAKCLKCVRQHLLFDADFHGWNGYVCHEAAQASLPRPPLVPWSCVDCGAKCHAASIRIYSEGQSDFVENAGDDFPAERWMDGFGWFYASITCDNCKKQSDDWVDYETM